MNLTSAPDPTPPCRDRRRCAWVPSLPAPALLALGPVAHRAWPQTAMLWLPAIFVYCIAPLIAMFTVACIPSPWFAPMDARLAAAVHFGPARIDFAPGRRAATMRRSGLADAAAANF